MKHKSQLPIDYALVLQHIQDMGSEDVIGLSESLRLERGRVVHIVDSLRHKGLLTTIYDHGHHPWLQLSHRGRKLMASLWPDRSAQVA